MDWKGKPDSRPGTDKRGQGSSTPRGNDWKGKPDVRPDADRRGGAKGK